MFRMMKRVVVGASLLVGLSSAAQAQFLTDAGSPLGAGGGLSGSVINFYGGATGNYVVGLGNAWNHRAGWGDNQSFPGPDGSIVNVNAADFAAVAGVLRNGSSGVATAAAAFGGTPAATALAQAFATLGQAQTAAAAIDAIRAYNAALDALPAGQAVPPVFAVARYTLTYLGARAAR